jgi:hypothetical protein
MVIWFIFHRFGMLHQEKSGNPERKKKNFEFGAIPPRPIYPAELNFDRPVPVQQGD